MILGQLIQTGRRFCECRSEDFIPKSEDEIVVLAYSIHDQFVAHSFDTDILDLGRRIRSWLQDSEAIGYILIRRQGHHFQCEFPFPIGRPLMDKVILTAATERSFQTKAFYLEERKELSAYKLIPTSSGTGDIDEATRSNLFQVSDNQSYDRSRANFPLFAEFAG